MRFLRKLLGELDPWSSEVDHPSLTAANTGFPPPPPPGRDFPPQEPSKSPKRPSEVVQDHSGPENAQNRPADGLRPLRGEFVVLRAEIVNWPDKLYLFTLSMGGCEKLEMVGQADDYPIGSRWQIILAPLDDMKRPP